MGADGSRVDHAPSPREKDEGAEFARFNRARKPFLAFGKVRLGLASQRACACLPDFPFYGRKKPQQIILRYAIVGAGSHHGDGGLFTDSSGHHDEGNILSRRLQQFERCRCIESRKAVVGDDDIPGSLAHRVSHGFARLHAPGEHLISAPRDAARNQFGVAFGILNLKYAQQLRHRPRP